MKIIIEQKAGEDYPAWLKGRKTFYEELKNVVRRRLEWMKL